MKKLIAVLMAIAMIAALSVTAFAAIESGNGSATITVTGNVNEQVKEDVYYVTLSQEALTFTYDMSDYEWDTENMKWVETDGANWAENSAEIVITSKSSDAVTATFTANATAPATLALQVKNSGDEAAAEVAVDLASAANTENPAENGTAQTATIVVTVGGTIAADDTAIGTITVQLS